MRFIVFIFLAALPGCTQTNSTESQSSSESTPADSSQSAPVEKAAEKEEEKPIAKISPPAQIPLTIENLIEFPFTSHVHEALFSDSGKFVLTSLKDGSEKTGTWLVNRDSLQITIDGNTARYRVEAFGPDDCQLTAGDEFSAKLFPKGTFDNSAEETTHLFRNTLSPPFPKEALHGQWSDPVYGGGFNPDGTFGHSEPDCWTEGSWKFDGENLVMRVTKSNCDVPPPRHLKVIRLSRKQLVMKGEDNYPEVWIRQ